MKKIILLSILAVTLFSCNKKPEKRDFVDYINPFIGTGGHGHTYPGAVVPFGMVQLSPDTKKDDWDHCSGYHYSDNSILGFSMTHLSGTGIGDYGDFRFVVETGPLHLHPADKKNHDKGYVSHFRKKNEHAEAGYYSVLLDDYNVKVELTATRRAGFQRYTFYNSNNAHVLIDLKEGVTSAKVLDAEVRIISDHEIAGYRHMEGWAKNRYIYFYAEFSKPFKSTAIVVNGKLKPKMKVARGTDLKVVVNYEPAKEEQIMVKTGISFNDYQGASENLHREIYDWDFDQIKTNAHYAWYNELSRIQVKSDNEKDKTIFYTALYHSFLAPNIASDIDFRYRSHDGNIYKDNSFTMYTVFSLWDTFRALHPLFTIVQRKKTVDMITSMLDMYKADSLLPMWELAANETNCMNGYHAVSVITDAYNKGIRDFDARLALQAMDKTATADHFGMKYYKAKGYVPADKAGASVSRTLEYAYDDWCIANLAQKLSDTGLYDKYIQRAQYYKNLFDKETGFFRAKRNGGFITPFDPTQVNFTLTEANTWQYNFFVPQDINTFIDLMGGNEAFDKKLDSLFTVTGLTGRKQSDITGLIGQYAHGNEPSHHMAYLYNYIGKPWKTQKIVHRIEKELYNDTPDGLSGNEDCGQMSAWYVLSALGFYPVTPGSTDYVLGTPVFDTVVINLENRNKFIIVAENLSPQNFYVQSVKWNGKEYNKSFITHKMIMGGGTLTFVMSGKPESHWGQAPDDRPHRRIADRLITPVPCFDPSTPVFKGKNSIRLTDLDDNAGIFYKEKDQKDFKKYSIPFTITGNKTFMAYAEKGGVKSFMEKAQYHRIPENVKVTYNKPYSKQYAATGKDAFVDGISGSDDFRSGNWQGFHGNDMDVVIDLGKAKTIHRIGAGFLQDMPSYIFMPLEVRFEVSAGGKTFEPAGTVKNNVDEHNPGRILKKFYSNTVDKPVRYIHIVAKNRKTCPDWHRGAGDKAWVFADEVWWE